MVWGFWNALVLSDTRQKWIIWSFPVTTLFPWKVIQTSNKLVVYVQPTLFYSGMGSGEYQLNIVKIIK